MLQMSTLSPAWEILLCRQAVGGDDAAVHVFTRWEQSTFWYTCASFAEGAGGRSSSSQSKLSVVESWVESYQVLPRPFRAISYLSDFFLRGKLQAYRDLTTSVLGLMLSQACHTESDYGTLATAMPSELTPGKLHSARQQACKRRMTSASRNTWHWSPLKIVAN